MAIVRDADGTIHGDPIASPGDPGYVTESPYAPHPSAIVPPPRRTLPIVHDRCPRPTAPAVSVPPIGAPYARLVEGDFVIASGNLGCAESFVHAVVEVESGPSGGFLRDGRPEILFESHQFHINTGGRFDREASGLHLSSPVWTHDYGAAGAHQWDRLEAAERLDAVAAVKSTSWGMFQVTGANYARAGFDDTDDFVRAMRSGQPAHLQAFVAFVRRSAVLTHCAQVKDFPGFSLHYNGAGYRSNDYDGKLRRADAKWVAILATHRAGDGAPREG